MGPPSSAAGRGASPLFGEDGGQPGPTVGNTHIGAMRRDPPRKHHGRQETKRGQCQARTVPWVAKLFSRGSPAMNVDLPRVQFAFTSINHFFFVPVTIGIDSPHLY